MKGAFKTQTLQDIIGAPALHHSGDKDDIFGFAGAFDGLQGTEAPLSDPEMQIFENMLATFHYPPNPNRNIDNSLSSTVSIQGPGGTVYAVGDAVAGWNSFMTGQGTSSHCFQCHGNARTRSGIVKERGNEFHPATPLIAENLRGFYDRMGFFRTSVDGSTSGTGYLPDGSQGSELINTLQNFPLQSQSGLHVHAFLLSIDGPVEGLAGDARDSHAGVGQQVTVDGNSASDLFERAEQFVDIANSGNIGLVASGNYKGELRQFMYVGSNTFQSDRSNERLTLTQLLPNANSSDIISFMLVPVGSEYRMGLDRNLDGILDGEVNGVADSPSTLGGYSSCALQGGRCDFKGSRLVRIGDGTVFFYTLAYDGISCSPAAFGIDASLSNGQCEFLDLGIAPPAASVSCNVLKVNQSQVLSFAGAQDVGQATIVNDGSGVRVFNNAWKAIDLNGEYNITENTVIDFDFTATINPAIIYFA